ncbi:MAG: NAD(P)/FAD-dependent oxidoreductase [Rhodospirillaceae bacterium]|nr:NAD(P)/FAD-dependent oxidoreductase [Rhodospirillaceae bacterium]
MAAQTIECDILIVGGGIGGSGLAAALRHRGYSIVVVEASKDPLDTARGDHIQPVVVEILDKWGCLSAFMARGAEKRFGTRYMTATGETILDCPLQDLPLPHPYYLVLHHEIIGQAFMDLAAENRQFTLIRPAWGRDFEVEGGDVVALRVKLPDGPDAVIRPKLVVGADGRSSQVRKLLGFATEDYEYKSPLVMLTAPRNMPDPQNNIGAFLGAKGMTFRIPRMRDHWKFSIPIDPSEIAWWKASTMDDRRKFMKERTPALGDLDISIIGFYPCKLANCTQWVRGNVVLIGDAANSLHPAHGQGMNIALRNAAVLANAIPPPDKIKDLAAVRGALAAFEAFQKPIMTRVLDGNHQRALEMDNRDPQAIMNVIPFYAGIQADPAKRQMFTWLTTGYPPPQPKAA